MLSIIWLTKPHNICVGSVLLPYKKNKNIVENERNYKYMTKADFIKSIGSKVENISNKDIALVLDALAETVVDVVKADDDVTIPGIGKVSVKTVPERRGKIMMGERKGEEYVVPEHREPKIKLAKSFKEVLL